MQTKKRLFITVGTFTTAIASALIEQIGNKNCEDYMVSIAPTLYESVDKQIKIEALLLNKFKNIWFYFDYCAPKHNFKDEKSYVLSFNVNQFKEATGNIEFDEIYSVYIHGAANYLFNQYPKAKLYFIEDGVATYLKMENSEKIDKRAKKIYTFNYFNKIIPYITTDSGVKTEAIKTDLVKNIFEKLAKTVNSLPEVKEKNIIFCAQNLSLNSSNVTFKEELIMYKDCIQDLLEKGYYVYFKEHPKTPNLFFNDLQAEINSEKLINLNSAATLPIEILVPHFKPTAIVSMFSTALLSVPHIFNVPAFCFTSTKVKQTIEAFDLAHLLVRSYVPNIKEIKNSPEETQTAFKSFINKTLPLKKAPIYRIKQIDSNKLFISKHEFKTIKKYLRKTDAEFIETSGIDKTLIDLYQNKKYLDFLLFYFNDFYNQFKKYSDQNRNSKSPKKTLSFLGKGFGIIFKLIF